MPLPHPKELKFVSYTPGQDRANTSRTPPSVEVIDLTDSADEDGASTIVDSDIDVSPANELQTAGSEEFTARRSTPQGNMCDESSSQPAPSEGSGQKNAIVKDCQLESDTNTGDKDGPLENDIVMQTHGGLEDPRISTSDRCGGEYSPAMENAIHSKPDDEHTSRASRLPLIRPTAAEFNAAIQEGGGSSLLKADRQDSRTTSSNSGSDGNVDDNNSTSTRNRKRKAHPPLKPYSNKRRKPGSRSRMDKHVEYEVKQIVDVRTNDTTGFLQYRVKWVGYKHDLTWYDASNFKNSPHKLDEFHNVNPTYPGPPKRLRVWLQCWEDTADHADDNKPL